MSNLIPGNNKHLTIGDRIYIESSLDSGLSFRDIARYLCKDPTTISRRGAPDTVKKEYISNKENLY